MKQQLIIMLEMQDAMNTKVNPDWRSANNEWYRAIWVECAEMLDHYGWKWWKHQEPDLNQVKLELIDILLLFFGLVMLDIDNKANLESKLPNLLYLRRLQFFYLLLVLFCFLKIFFYILLDGALFAVG